MGPADLPFVSAPRSFTPRDAVHHVKSQLSTMNSAPSRPGQRPSASVLWAHLLRRDTSALPSSGTQATSSTSYTPIAPIDKNGASMRILLLDASHNLEKFSERVDKLTNGVDQAKVEIIALHKMFQNEHDDLVNNTLDIVNRCKAELQRSLGSPAQEDKVEDMRKDLVAIDRRLEAMDKRIDVLHTLHQSQSDTFQVQAQALQSQVEAFQALQSQQSNMISMLSPLLPLLQAVPLHIETARNCITDALLKEVQKIPSSHTTCQTPDQVHTSSSFRLQEGQSSTLVSNEPSSSPEEFLSPNKRRRIEAKLDVAPACPIGPAKQQRHKSRALWKATYQPGSAHGSRRTAGQNVSFSNRRSLATGSPSREHFQLETPIRHTSKTGPPIIDICRSPRDSISSFPSEELAQKPITPNKKSSAHPGHITASTMQPGLENHDRIRSIAAMPRRDHANLPRQGIPQANDAMAARFAGTSSERGESLVGTNRISLVDVSTPKAAGGPSRSGITRALSHWQVGRVQRYSSRALSNNTGNLPNNLTPTKVAHKPMSIKDRKAHHLNAQGISRKEGKRFIPLGDDEDEDEDIM